MAGLVAGLAVGPLFPFPVGWSAFAATALGVPVCGMAFAGVTVTALSGDVTSHETRP
ncbi:MAG: hypothetical protein H7Y15_03080 [Pseudonocardia sp.]|nr:hypothetical protein [Pseudonocardia sp.]